MFATVQEPCTATSILQAVAVVFGSLAACVTAGVAVNAFGEWKKRQNFMDLASRCTEAGDKAIDLVVAIQRFRTREDHDRGIRATLNEMRSRGEFPDSLSSEQAAAFAENLIWISREVDRELDGSLMVCVAAKRDYLASLQRVRVLYRNTSTPALLESARLCDELVEAIHTLKANPQNRDMLGRPTRESSSDGGMTAERNIADVPTDGEDDFGNRVTSAIDSALNALWEIRDESITA